MRKNNKGFTLIELLAVLIVISLIALITVTNVSKMLSKSKDTLYSNQVKQIEKAARVWGADHIMILPSDSNSENTCNYDEIEECDKKYKTLIITLKTLQDGGYIDKDIKNPKNNEIIDPDTIITITKNGKSIDYKVDLDDGSSFGGTIDTSKQYSTAHVEQLGLKGVVYMDPTDLSKECNAQLAAANVDSSTNLPTGIKTGCMKFYIFDDSGDKYKMILDHSTSTHIQWATEADFLSAGGSQADWDNNIWDSKGPVTANKKLKEDTAGWKGNPRLITANEVSHIVGADKTDTLNWNSDTAEFDDWFYLDGGKNEDPTSYSNENGWKKQIAVSKGASSYAWLYNYTYDCESTGCDYKDNKKYNYETSSGTNSGYNYSYWTNDSIHNKNDSIYSLGRMGLFDGRYGFTTGRSGIRPVIEIEKDKIDVDDSSTSEPESFATDSWETIAANTTSDKYKVGDTKCVALTGLTTTNDNGCSNGEFKVRIANTSTPSECSTEGYSQTACGFVVEFIDIISEHNMNPSGEYKGKQHDYGWNVDGYPASAMYQEYFASNATNSLYAKLPSDLQSAIIDTKVISGHGSTTGETNFTSTDKLYLLSTKEVGFDVDYDTAKAETRILDYYNTNNNNTSRKKQYNRSNKYWWLRSARSRDIGNFCIVVNSGGRLYDYASATDGVAPAFRIGK